MMRLSVWKEGGVNLVGKFVNDASESRVRISYLHAAVITALCYLGLFVATNPTYSEGGAVTGPNYIEVDPNLVCVVDPATGEGVLGWTPAELIGDKENGDGRGNGSILTYDQIKGMAAVPGDVGAKHIYNVPREEVTPAEGLVTFISRGSDGEGEWYDLGIPKGCKKGGDPTPKRFKVIGPWGIGGKALMPSWAEGNWLGAAPAGAARIYERGYVPIR